MLLRMEISPEQSGLYVDSFILSDLRGVAGLSHGTYPLGDEGGSHANTFLVGTGPPSMVCLPVPNLTEQSPWCSLPSPAGVLQNSSNPDKVLGRYQMTSSALLQEHSPHEAAQDWSSSAW